MMARHWWKLGLGTGLLLGTPACGLGQVLTPPAGFSPRTVAKGKPIARGSLLHTANWPDTPLGYSVALHSETQIANAAASRMILHDYDFVPGTSALNDRGKDRVLRIAALLPHNRFPVVVERLPYAPALAEVRRRTVLAGLAAASGGVAPERVVVGRPASVPLQGPEAELIYMNLLRLAESAGTVPGTGVRNDPATGIPGGAGGGTSTGGFGTGGMR
jgi:hypothetical protein